MENVKKLHDEKITFNIGDVWIFHTNKRVRNL